MDDTISRQAAIDAVYKCADIFAGDMPVMVVKSDAYEALAQLPSAQPEVLACGEGELSAQPDYQEVLGWLLAYHTMSFDLHGRYLPHEVISWLINDFTKGFIAERITDDSD